MGGQGPPGVTGLGELGILGTAEMQDDHLEALFRSAIPMISKSGRADSEP
jgi:hypothetical protein